MTQNTVLTILKHCLQYVTKLTVLTIPTILTLTLHDVHTEAVLIQKSTNIIATGIRSKLIYTKLGLINLDGYNNLIVTD